MPAKRTAPESGFDQSERQASMTRSNKTRLLSYSSESPTAQCLSDHTDYPSPFKPLGRGQIRVLHVKMGEADDPIRCSLDHITLNEFVFYEALSYTWASEDDQRDRSLSENIILEGYQNETFPVTKNCLAALKAIRLPKGPRCLWVDSICILQNNENDKVRQIGMMADIYKHATKVLAYVGQNVQHPEDLRHVMKNQIYDGHSGTVASFFEQPYFSRLWVIQEIILAKAVEFLFAGTSMFFSRYDNKWIRDIASLEDPEKRHGPSWLTMSLGNRARDLTLSRILTKTRGAQCFDPRDKIFGVLGIFDSEFGTLDRLKSSHDKTQGLSVRQVYTAVTSHILTRERCHFPVFRLCAGPQAKFDLPSWVIDWTCRSLQAPWVESECEPPQDKNTLGLSNFFRWPDNFKAINTNHGLEFHPTDVCEESGTLRLSGRRLWNLANASISQREDCLDPVGRFAWWSLDVFSQSCRPQRRHQINSPHKVIFKTPHYYQPTSDDYIFVADKTAESYIVRRAGETGWFMISESFLLLNQSPPSSHAHDKIKDLCVALRVEVRYRSQRDAEHELGQYPNPLLNNSSISKISDGNSHIKRNHKGGTVGSPSHLASVVKNLLGAEFQSDAQVLYFNQLCQSLGISTQNDTGLAQGNQRMSQGLLSQMVPRYVHGTMELRLGASKNGRLIWIPRSPRRSTEALLPGLAGNSDSPNPVAPADSEKVEAISDSTPPHPIQFMSNAPELWKEPIFSERGDTDPMRTNLHYLWTCLRAERTLWELYKTSQEMTITLI